MVNMAMMKFLKGLNLKCKLQNFDRLQRNSNFSKSTNSNQITKTTSNAALVVSPHPSPFLILTFSSESGNVKNQNFDATWRKVFQKEKEELQRKILTFLGISKESQTVPDIGEKNLLRFVIN